MTTWPNEKTRTFRKQRAQDMRNDLAMYRRGVGDVADAAQLDALGRLAQALAQVLNQETGGRDGFYADVKAIYLTGSRLFDAARAKRAIDRAEHDRRMAVREEVTP